MWLEQRGRMEVGERRGDEGGKGGEVGVWERGEGVMEEGRGSRGVGGTYYADTDLNS